MIRRSTSLLSLSLALALALAGGCATAPRPAVHTAAQEQTGSHRAPCSTRALLLSSAAHNPNEARLDRAPNGFAIAWTELRHRWTLRFVVVDGTGAPRFPSVEVVDRTGPLKLMYIDRDEPAGYAVVWMEGAKAYVRSLDSRGRPRSDVEPVRDASMIGRDSVCFRDGAIIRCKTASHSPLEFPTSTKIIDNLIVPDRAAIIASDAEGLKLIVQSCSKE